MALLAERQIAGVAAASVALATLCAAAVGAGAGVGGLDVPLLGLLVALAASSVVAANRTSTGVLAPGKDVVVLTAVTVAGFVGLYVVGWTSRQHEADIARLVPLVVLGLSVLWPEPNVLRYCLLLAGGTLLGAAGDPVRSKWAVGGALVAMAVALVSTNRLTAASGPRLGGAAPARARRVATEAAVVLVVVGLLAALAASLLPPPPGQGGGEAGQGNRRQRGRPPGPPVRFDDRLDVGTARGKRSDQPVFLVDAPAADVWRATTYDHWDGEAWSRSPGDLTYLDDEVVEPGIGDPAPDPGRVDVLGFYQTVTVLARSAEVLVAAARPTYASAFDGDVRQGPDASLYPVTALGPGQQYVVSSQRPTTSAAALRAAGDTSVGAVPADVADAYLQLPQVSPRVRALAAEVVAGASTTYDKVRALEHWVDDHTTVTDDAAAVPAGRDPLETFLLEERSGPPERAATSLAVMLRALGVPARIAIGFLPGTRSGPNGEFLVRSSDTHAWVEAWFPGAGWERFDPTGRAPDPRAGGDSVWDRLLRFLRSLWPLVLLAVLVGAGWLAWRAERWRRRRAALPWATRFFARMERAGSARGRPRRAQETPAEYANGLATGVLGDPRLVEVGALVTVAAYSPHEPAAEDRARAEAVLRAATRAAPVRLSARLRRRTRTSPAQGPTIPRP